MYVFLNVLATLRVLCAGVEGLGEASFKLANCNYWLKFSPKIEFEYKKSNKETSTLRQWGYSEAVRWWSNDPEIINKCLVQLDTLLGWSWCVMWNKNNCGWGFDQSSKVKKLISKLQYFQILRSIFWLLVIRHNPIRHYFYST